MLEARINQRRLVVGDLNACAAIKDDCEGCLVVARGLGEGLQGEEGFWEPTAGGTSETG